MSKKQQALAAAVLADIAISMDVQPEELGGGWVELTEALAQLVCTAKRDDREAIGRITQAIVDLP